MPLSDATPGALVLSPLPAGTAALVGEEWDESESGWDSLRLTYIARAASAAAALALVPARGTRRSGSVAAWVVGRSAYPKAPGFHEVRVECLGLLSARGCKVVMEAGFQQPLATSGAVSATLQYIHLGAPLESTGIGGAATPPAAHPGVPPRHYTAMADPLFTWTTGWRLMARQQEGLPGVEGVWLVGDTYQYFRRAPAA